MKPNRRVPLKKENSTDNYYKDSLKPRPISFSPKRTTTSQSRIPLPKIPKTKPENLIITDNSELIENEIESKLRLKLQSEYIQRFHSLQNKYDNQISKSSNPLHTSFIKNLTDLFTAKQQNQLLQNNKDHSLEEDEEIDQYEYEYEYEYENENSGNEGKFSNIPMKNFPQNPPSQIEINQQKKSN